MTTRREVENRMTPPPLVVAHRGSSGREPENTLRAFRAAIRDGADVLECDVRPTRDGEPVLFHDATLERLTGERGRIEELSLEGVRRLRVQIGPRPRAGGERVPTLEELTRLAARRARLAVEIKIDGAGAGSRRCANLVLKVVEILCRSGHGDAAIISFSAEVVDRLQLRERWPTSGLILGTRTGKRTVRQAIERPESLLVIQKSLVDEIVLRWARLRAKRIWTYAVDSPAELRRLAARGLDGIITNFPDRLRRVLESTINGGRAR